MGEVGIETVVVAFEASSVLENNTLSCKVGCSVVENLAEDMAGLVWAAVVEVVEEEVVVAALVLQLMDNKVTGIHSRL